MSHNITVQGGTSVRLPTAGKYCDRDIFITAEAGEPEEVKLQSKTVTPKKSVQEITADEDYSALEKVTVEAISDEYIIPSGTLDIAENGTFDVTGYAAVTVNVPTGSFEDLGPILTEQEALIEELQETLKGKASGGGDFPVGYSLADYIQFTGEQLVDTGIIGNQDTQIRISFTWGNATQNHVFGCASSDNTASITSYMNGSWRFGNKSATKTIMKNNTVLPYAAIVNKSMISVTSSSTAIGGVNDFETVGTLLLGGARSASGSQPSSGFVGRVFYFYLWAGDTQVLKLVPVTDGTVFRFYDMVSGAFFDSITDTPLGGGYL